MNDPIPFFDDAGSGGGGDWHVFFQHNPAEALWGNMTWGHAVSRDLIHWQTLPNAIRPGPGHYDQAGIYTGSIIAAQGGYWAFYTSVSSIHPLRQTQSLATSQDLITWSKYENNPLIFGPPRNNAETFRDPQVWRENDHYYMLIGGEKPNRQGGQAFLYRSTDLLRWEYRGVLAEGTTAESEYDWECPDLFPLGPDPAARVLITARHHVFSHVGTYANERLTVRSVTRIETPTFYAPKSAADSTGRSLLFGWLKEPDEQAAAARGWSGVLSLPRELYLTSRNLLAQRPARELDALKGQKTTLDPFTAPKGTTPLETIQGDCLILHLRAHLGQATSLTLHLRQTPNGSESTPLTYDRQSHTLQGVPCPEPQADTLDLTIYIDKSTIESFAHGAAATQRTYPNNPTQATRISLSPNSEIDILQLTAWRPPQA
jgi:beta-fructofuranosidase